MELQFDIDAVSAIAQKLTPRELEVVEMAARGLTDREISTKLGISRETVTTYWRRILTRFNASSRTEVVAKMAMASPNGQVAGVKVASETGDQAIIRSSELAQRNLLDAVANSRLRVFGGQVDYTATFEVLLSNLTSVTESEFGFVGEVLYSDQGIPYLKSFALTNIAWNADTRELYAKESITGFEFRNLDTLFGHVLKTGKTVVSNDPANDPRAGGTPEGHPTLRAFLGIPIHAAQGFIGMIGLANRPGGYDIEMERFLDPLVTLCSNAMMTKRAEDKRVQQMLDTKSRIHALSHFTDRVPAGAILESDEGEILFCNPKLCDLFRLPVSPSALEGQRWTDAVDKLIWIFREPSYAEALMNSLVASGESRKGIRLPLIDGRCLRLDFHAISGYQHRPNYLYVFWEELIPDATPT